MAMDTAAYILAGLGGLFLAFAGLHGFENKSVTIVSFGIGAVMIVLAGCLYWQDAIWKADATSRSASPAVLRAKLQEKVEQTFQNKRAALIAANMPPSEIDELYRWRDDILKQLDAVLEFINSTSKQARSTIARKALAILEERGVDATIEFLTATLQEEEKNYRRRGRELAEASLLKGSLQQLSLDHIGAKASMEKAISFDPSWWLPHNLLGVLELNLAHWRAAQQQFDEAEKLTHLEQDLSAIYSNRAALFKNTGRFQEAETLMRRSLAINEKYLGPKDPNVAVCLVRLAGLLLETNRPGEAEPLARRALVIFEAKTGKESADLGLCLNILGLVLRNTDRLADAETAFQRALPIIEKNFGREHPAVAMCLSNLVLIFQGTGRISDAEPLMRRALEIDRNAYGEEHPAVAIRLSNLAYILKETNRFAEAEQMYWAALAIDQKCFGWDHPNVAIRLNNLAQLLRKTHRLYEAEPMMWEALRIDENTSGSEQPEVAVRLNNLAVLLQETHRLPESEPMMKRSLLILFKSTLNNGHPNPFLERGVLSYRRTLEKLGIPASEIGLRLESICREAGFDETGARQLLQSLP